MLISEQLSSALVEGADELAQQLRGRVRKVLAHPDWDEIVAFRAWFDQEFPLVTSGRTPKGMKKVKADADFFIRVFHAPTSDVPALQQTMREKNLPNTMQEIGKRWKYLEPHVDELARHFSRKTKAAKMAELKVGNITFKNEAGVGSAAMKRYAASLAAVFQKLKGWRRKAIGSGLTVVLAPATAFRGTSSGRYRAEKDQLLVRATPKVMKGLGRGTYGSPEYILIHELGHRYDRKHPTPENFDSQRWYTTRYSRTDSVAGSEAFAELFALGHFGIKKAHISWDPEIQVRFEKLMSH